MKNNYIKLRYKYTKPYNAIRIEYISRYRGVYLLGNVYRKNNEIFLVAKTKTEAYILLLEHMIKQVSLIEKEIKKYEKKND